MFDFLGNINLGAFLKLWGVLGTAALIGIGALVLAIRAKNPRIFLEVAAFAFAFNAVLGWGAYMRDDLCVAQRRQDTARFKAAISANNQQTEIDMANFAKELTRSEIEIDKRTKELEDEINRRTEVACRLSPDDLRAWMRQPNR